MDPSEIEGDEDVYRAGTVVAGKYELVSVLGRGGMGAVWLARNLNLDADVAIKLIRHETASKAASDRLLVEARAAARLNHPSIVRVFDFGETAQGDPFIVMEVVRGESLADVLDRRIRLNAISAVQMLLPIASALSAAHLRGIIHRDLKPENVILVTGEEGTLVPKLVDFGIAKVQQDDAAARPLTQAGVALGTPDYMSPEQIRSSPDVDERTDVWSFSVLLYEAIAGRRPFSGPNAMSTYGAILADDPMPLSDLGAGDAQLWSIVSSGLGKKPASRPASMRALGRQLALWLRHHEVELDVAGQSLALHWLKEGSSAIDDSWHPPDGAVPRGAVTTRDAAVAMTGQEPGLGSMVPRPRSLRHLLAPAAVAAVALVGIVVVAAGEAELVATTAFPPAPLVVTQPVPAAPPAEAPAEAATAEPEASKPPPQARPRDDRRREKAAAKPSTKPASPKPAKKPNKSHVAHVTTPIEAGF